MQHIVGQPLRAGSVGQVAVKYGFHQRVAAGDHIADNKHVGIAVNLAGVPAFDQFDAEGAQLVGHRRVDVGVAACDGVAGGACNRSEPAHEGAANTENVQMHDVY